MQAVDLAEVGRRRAARSPADGGSGAPGRPRSAAARGSLPRLETPVSGSTVAERSSSPRCRSIVRRARSSSSMVVRSSWPRRSASGVPPGSRTTAMIPGPERCIAMSSPPTAPRKTAVASPDGRSASETPSRSSIRAPTEPASSPSSVGRASVPVAQRADGRRSGGRHRRGCAASSGSRSSAFSGSVCERRRQRDDLRDDRVPRRRSAARREPSRSASRPMAPAASSAALAIAGRWIGPMPPPRAAAAAPSRSGAIGDSTVAVAGMTVSSAAASAAAMTADGRPDQPGRAAGDPARSDERCRRQQDARRR